MLELYKNIKKRRKELGMTQDELGKKVGYVNGGMISKIEKGEVDLPQSKVKVFADALDTTTVELFGRSINVEIETLDTSAARTLRILGAYYEKLSALNDAGIDKVVNYIDDLADSGKYKK